MEVLEINGKKINQSVKHQHQRGQLRKHQNRDARLMEENEKIVEELQQQMIYIQRNDIFEKRLDLDSAKSKAWRTLDCKWHYSDEPIYSLPMYRNSELDEKKMELKKLTFTHGAYRDKKAVLCFSSGEPEVNIHNLNYRMLHEARSMGGERRLLNMANPNKPSNSGSSLKELDQQICWSYDDYYMKCRLNSISERDKARQKLMELLIEKEQLFCDAPVKGSLWNSMPSKTDLRKQIQALESSKEATIKIIIGTKNVKGPYKGEDPCKGELRKAENEIKSLRDTMETIRQKKQEALQTLSHLKEST